MNKEVVLELVRTPDGSLSWNMAGELSVGQLIDVGESLKQLARQQVIRVAPPVAPDKEAEE